MQSLSEESLSYYRLKAHDVYDVYDVYDVPTLRMIAAKFVLH
jgi:hypothetical protein